MSQGLDRNGLEVLDPEECRRLLAQRPVGRIGLVTPDGAPLVLPVNFLLDGDRVLVLTTAGSKLDVASSGGVLCLEVDDFDVLSHYGWSVVVTGPARAITDEAELSALSSAPVGRWARGGDPTLIEIALDQVSGRRLNKV